MGNKWVTTILNVTQNHKNLFNIKIPEPTFHAPLHHTTKRYSPPFSSLPRRRSRVRFPSRVFILIACKLISLVFIRLCEVFFMVGMVLVCVRKLVIFFGRLCHWMIVILSMPDLAKRKTKHNQSTKKSVL